MSYVGLDIFYAHDEELCGNPTCSAENFPKCSKNLWPLYIIRLLQFGSDMM
jgi:hypothetical protein